MYEDGEYPANVCVDQVSESRYRTSWECFSLFLPFLCGEKKKDNLFSRFWETLPKKICQSISLTGLIWHAIMPLAQPTTRGGAVAARRAHNPKVPGSSPGPATDKNAPFQAYFCFKI